MRSIRTRCSSARPAVHSISRPAGTCRPTPRISSRARRRRRRPERPSARYNRPPSVAAASEAYLGAQDLVGQFLDETCAMNEPGRTETASALYAAWTAWAKAAGEPPGSQRQLAAVLDVRGFARSRTEHARLYRGLRLLTPEERLTHDAS